MPYKAFSVDGQYCVYKLDEAGERTGETLGCHDTEAEANAQVKALYANEPDIGEAATLKTRVQALMRDATAVLSDKSIPASLRKEIEDVRGALKKTWADLEADADGEDEQEEADMPPTINEAMKTIDGVKYPSSAFLIVEDSEKVNTWHLRVKDKNGKVNHRLLGAAWAALHGGYRGNEYEGPDKTKAIRKLKALYKSEDMEAPSAENFKELAYTFGTLRAEKETREAMYELEDLVYQFRDLAWNIIYSNELDDKPAALKALANEFIELATEELSVIGEKQAEFEEVQLGEADIGSILSFTESQIVDADEPAPLTLDVVVIEPGWGNKKDNHYYSAEMLKEHAKVFKGAKMYATDHKADEKNVLTEVSQVLECPVSFTETGAPVARVGVFDDTFAQSIRNRAALGKLEDLHVSILANGTARPYEENGRKGKYVETIASGASVDWVTRAGAGGHALRLAENSNEEGGDMPPETKVEEKDQKPVEEPKVEPQEEPRDQIKEGAEPAQVPAAEPVRLSETEVVEALQASNLPDASRKRLAVGEYETAEQLQTAITGEAEYVAQLTGAGKPIGQHAQDRAPKTEPMTDEQYREALDAVDARFGLK